MLLLCAALCHLTYGYSPTHPYIYGHSYELSQPQTAQVTYKKYSWQSQVQRTYNWEPNGRTYSLSHTNNGQGQDYTYGLSQTAGSQDDTYKFSHTSDGDAVPNGLTQTNGGQIDIYGSSQEANSQEISPTLIPESEDETNTPNDYLHNDDVTETTKIFTSKSETKNQTATSRPLRSTTPITKSGTLTKLKRPFTALQFEWHVGIYSKRYSPYMQICGGSLVKNDVVLSAAHCFWDDDVGLLQPSLFAVAGGKLLRAWDTKGFTKRSEIKEIKIPPRFQGSKTSLQDDIAVLLLTNSLEYAFGVKPICVSFDEDRDREQLSSGNNGTITGWGLTTPNGQPSHRLVFLSLPYVEIEECIRTADASFLKYITSDKICAGEQNGRRALCRGDSGGGLAYYSSYTPYLRGIASTAQRDDKNECNTHAIASFTHVLVHKRFLVQHVPGIGKDCEELYDRGSENTTTSGLTEVKKEENSEPRRNGTLTSTMIENTSTTNDKRNFTVLPQATEDEQDRKPIWGFAD